MNVNHIHNPDNNYERKNFNYFDGNSPFQTFHHLLYDSLMPWLKENHDPLRFRSLLPYILNNKKHFFDALLLGYREKRLALDNGLLKEWKAFSNTKAKMRPAGIFYSWHHAAAESQQVVFYFELIAHTLLYSLSFQMQLMEDNSTPMKQFYVNRWLKNISDLRLRSHQLYLKEDFPHKTIVFITDIALAVMERELQEMYRRFCQPIMLISNLPLPGPMASHDTQSRSLMDYLAQWYKTLYIPHLLKGTDAGGSNKETITGNLMKEQALRGYTDGGQKQEPATNSGQEEDSGTEETVDGNDAVVIGTKEAGKLLGIGKTKLNQLCQNGDIPSFKIGKNRKFVTKEVLAYRNKLQVDKHYSDKNQIKPSTNK